MELTEVPSGKPDILLRLSHNEAKALKWMTQVIRFEHELKHQHDEWTRNGKTHSRETVRKLDDALTNATITSVWN